MKKIINNEYFLLVCRIVLGFFLLAAGISKIAEPHLFATEIGNYKMFPEFIVNLTAIILPWIELLCGLMLIVGLRIKTNSLLALGMLVVFIIAVASAMFRGLNINCGCYSAANAQPIGWAKIFENLGLLLLSIILFVSNNLKLTLEKFIYSQKN